ncbi:MAG: SAM-dependent methyltransferase [Desulfovibrio sp.]|uniref:SAM-dependent methyltransferase n=1 Tax=Desulfovibrio sp. 7SRBS1 TaxID=3378064 RepID=UPI003B3E8F67
MMETVTRAVATLCLALPLLAFSAAASAGGTGHLYLVGMGVGDRDNMTVRAVNVLKQADVVFAMRGMQKQYADMLDGKEVHDAGHGLYASFGHRGSAKAAKALARENREIIRQAVAEGKTVAIIDGGDPMVYGPHTGYLKEFADLHPEVVPGVSSFNAANAALLRAVTSGHASHSAILTAAMGAKEGYQGKDTLAELARSQSSMVFFTMGMDLPEVVRQLRAHYPGDTPIAIVSYAGYRSKQKVLEATLDTVIEKTSGGKLPFEHLIYVGDFLK